MSLGKDYFTNTSRTTALYFAVYEEQENEDQQISGWIACIFAQVMWKAVAETDKYWTAFVRKKQVPHACTLKHI